MKYSNCKEINRLVKIAINQGAVFVRRSKHGQLRFSDGSTVQCVPCSPSDQNGLKNFRCELKRNGINPAINAN